MGCSSSRNKGVEPEEVTDLMVEKDKGGGTVNEKDTPSETTAPKGEQEAPATEPPAKSKVNEELLVETKKNFEEMFDLGRELGRGAYSIVYEGKNKKTGEVVAVKCLKLNTLPATARIQLTREINILSSLSHENILRLIDTYEDNDNFYIITELVLGKELFEKIVDRGHYSEQDAARVIRQVVEALDYMHKHDIVHRDLKPENLLTSGEGEEETIKVADFGLSKNFDEAKLQTRVGSPSYVAPEVLSGREYDQAVDMWSVGVIIYVLLCGFPPFYSDNVPELFGKIMKVEFDFDYEEWEDISDDAKNLIKKLLVKNPKKRLTAEEVLKHSWLQNAQSLSTKALSVNKLKKYTQEYKSG
mmetsp:Transcript_21543/g.54291  ORF Transcript_21543/g.54291 Transcript_21543/m.54291 type:complete len:358 (-) Transcript_21543:83-1156(-)|eukprot:CAMPEP_0177654386 /NCGR_PEP_ID=MMETSP0447-20121125/14299_1 /TAXON_ID=0 /ORGANISM="Stygamoeba regulata, Strain BSH-02190019" /LENGTH=357 /DNA_ID=CAMNT_0019158021 /DNA_START=42 /DNA_END=1115 /DNA_ORIENTATION=-